MHLAILALCTRLYASVKQHLGVLFVLTSCQLSKVQAARLTVYSTKSDENHLACVSTRQFSNVLQYVKLSTRLFCCSKKALSNKESQSLSTVEKAMVALRYFNKEAFVSIALLEATSFVQLH